jgi:hypothetical protein
VVLNEKAEIAGRLRRLGIPGNQEASIAPRMAQAFRLERSGALVANAGVVESFDAMALRLRSELATAADVSGMTPEQKIAFANEQNPPKRAGTPFRPHSAEPETYAHLSPEQKIALGNEFSRPDGL